MQTNIATPTPHALPANSLVVPGSVKTLTHIALAGAVTFGLFVMMAKLIEQNAEVPVPTETPVLANIVLDVEEDGDRTRVQVQFSSIYCCDGIGTTLGVKIEIWTLLE